MPAFDLILTYKFLKQLTTPFEEMDAFKLGLIDDKGKLLKKPKTKEEKEAYSSFDRVIVNLKRILVKIPGGNSKFGSYAAALFLLREDHDRLYSDSIMESKIKGYMRELREDAPVNNVGGGAIAGVNNPGVWQKKRKKRNRIAYLRRMMANIKEETEKDSASLTIFDVDDTLFHTFAEIKVLNRKGEVIKSLNNQEFNVYKLKRGETFDFSEFRNSKKFYDTSRPMGKMISKLKAILKHVERKPNSKVIILTARADFDEKEVFLNTFRKYGIDIDKIYVERAGNLGNGPSAQNKKVIIKKYLDKYDYKRVRMFDDARSNLDMFVKLKDEYPNTEFLGWLVDGKGNPKKYKR